MNASTPEIPIVRKIDGFTFINQTIHESLIKEYASKIELQQKIIEKLKESNEFYANEENWKTPESQGFGVNRFSLGVSDMIEEIDSRNSDCGGILARQIKKEVEEMEKLK